MVQAVAAAGVREAETRAYRVHVVEVHKVAPNVFAIYEPHQSEETIGYLIAGNARALLFDTGMGIGDLKALTLKLNKHFRAGHSICRNKQMTIE